MIRRAKISEITDILVIVKACAQHMIEKNIHQWNEHYPTSVVFERDIENKELYVLILKSEIIGTIAISTFIDEEYRAVKWQSPDGKNSYVHRLSIHPKYQGKGYARQLMDYAEAHAKKSYCTSVRLDTFSQNFRNQKFYKARGYKKLGDIYFPKQSEHPFHCYELLL